MGYGIEAKKSIIQLHNHISVIIPNQSLCKNLLGKENFKCEVKFVNFNKI